MFLDYKLELVGQDNRIGICCVCGEELTSVDTVLRYNDDLYCNIECLKTTFETFETELEEKVECDFCEESLDVGEKVITDLDGLIFCCLDCLYREHGIEEVIGYDIQ